MYVSSICIRNHAHLFFYITASRFMFSLSSVLQDVRSEWCIPCCRHGRVYLCCKILSHSSMCHYILFRGTTMNPRGRCGLLRPHCSDDHSAHSERASWLQGFSCSRLDFDGREQASILIAAGLTGTIVPVLHVTCTHLAVVTVVWCQQQQQTTCQRF